jgi:hypothetical protein
MSWKVSSLQSLKKVPKHGAVERTWKFSDPVLQSIADKETNAEELTIPLNALREESRYSVSFTATNAKGTFHESASLDFIPVNCRHYEFEGATLKNQLTVIQQEPQATKDITFKMVLDSHNAACAG